MHLITRDELPEFVEGLQKYFPRSLMAYHIARNQLMEKFAWNGTQLVVDSYPDYSVCLTVQDATKEGEVSYPTGEYQAVTIFATDKTALESLLDQPNILNWKRKIAFLDVDSDHMDTVRKICEKYGTVDGAEEKCRCLMFILPKKIWQRMPAPVLGEGLREGPLEIKHIEQIAKEWNVEGRGGDIEGTYPLFRKLISEQFPSVAIFNDKDELVAYSMYDVVGSAAKAYTREDYRNQGIFQYVSYALPKKIFEQTGHEMLFGNVYTHNAASLKVFTKVRDSHEWQTYTLFFTPNKARE